MTPDLHAYRWVLVNISGGKDSQTALGAIVRLAREQDYPRSRIVCVFADLGKRDEWASTRELGGHLVALYGDRPGAAELAALHAAHYGLRLVVTRRRKADGTETDLLTRITERGRWPSAQQRYCTSDMKRTPVTRVMTQLAAEARAGGHSGPVAILSVLGMRAAESPARAKLVAFQRDERASNGLRTVDTWLPIHGLSTAEVWASVRASGVPYHWVYDAGLPRLSCRFCVLAGKHALGLAAQLDPGGAWERAEAEAGMGHQFRQDVSMLDVLELAEARPALRVVDPAEPNALAWAG